MRFRTLLPFLSLAAVSACVAPPRPAAPGPAAPPPMAVPTPPPAPAADWRDRPYTPGDWRHAVEGDRPAARYTTTDGTVLVSLTCDRPTRTVSLALPGAAAALTVRTTSTVRSLPARALPAIDAASPPTIVATLAAADPLLDAMAFSRGRFTIEQPGRPPLVLPAWAEVGRVVGDCRG